MKIKMEKIVSDYKARLTPEELSGRTEEEIRDSALRSYDLQQDMDDMREWAWTNNPLLYDLLTKCYPESGVCPAKGQPDWNTCNKCEYLKPEFRDHQN